MLAHFFPLFVLGSSLRGARGGIDSPENLVQHLLAVDAVVLALVIECQVFASASSAGVEIKLVFSALAVHGIRMQVSHNGRTKVP